LITLAVIPISGFHWIQIRNQFLGVSFWFKLFPFFREKLFLNAVPLILIGSVMAIATLRRIILDVFLMEAIAVRTRRTNWHPRVEISAFVNNLSSCFYHFQYISVGDRIEKLYCILPFLFKISLLCLLVKYTKSIRSILRKTFFIMLNFLVTIVEHLFERKM